ncbi:hypothetical protein RchiOBHm_Chr3g0458131 [Rosa chinensis]|uniref:Cell division control protein 24 OB domain-containing protein n=1 Tax=Rosa chinensis TaxID=74649 RepID=A0A2P6R7R7_ROSCH|nr:hypothetical protein RchiOBHm_Chr3g0458131 [Rosa chinensis]
MQECVKQLRKKYKRRKLSNTVTIDSIYKKNFLSLNSVLEVVIVDVFVLPGHLHQHLSAFPVDFWSPSTIDLYLHRK